MARRKGGDPRTLASASSSNIDSSETHSAPMRLRSSRGDKPRQIASRNVSREVPSRLLSSTSSAITASRPGPGASAQACRKGNGDRRRARQKWQPRSQLFSAASRATNGAHRRTKAFTARSRARRTSRKLTASTKGQMQRRCRGLPGSGRRKGHIRRGAANPPGLKGQAGSIHSALWCNRPVQPHPGTRWHR